MESALLDGIRPLCHTYGIRTTLDIDDHLMESLMTRYPGKSKTKAVEAAIAEHLRRGAVDWLLENAGRIEIDDVSKEMRALDRQI
jgi:hypothetical protein